MGGSPPSMSSLNFPHKWSGRNVREIPGTLLRTGGTVGRDETMALMSLSFIVENDAQSIGNGRRRVPSRRVPRVMTFLISASVQLPRPVSLSDVRLPAG